jgi:hypothetical protein
MKIQKCNRVAFVLAASVMGAVSAKAEVLNVPSSAATTGDTVYPPCVAQGTFGFVAGYGTCNVRFAINVPVGHTIEQISVVHSTDSTISSPSIIASLVPVLLQPLDFGQEFYWSSVDYVPDNTVGINNLMTQTATKGGILYPDQFQVQPNTLYNVSVQLQNGAGVQGILVTYQ